MNDCVALNKSFVVVLEDDVPLKDLGIFDIGGEINFWSLFNLLTISRGVVEIASP